MTKYMAIYYVEDNANCNYELKGVCAQNNIGLDYEIDFGRLIGRVLTTKPDMLIFNLQEYQKNKKYLQIFKDDLPFSVPMIFVIGNIKPDFSLNLPSNYNYLTYDEIGDFFSKITVKLQNIQRNEEFMEPFTTNVNDQIYKVLVDLGFNVSTNGTQFIKDCVNEILINKCKPSVFSKSIYNKIAFAYNTTAASVARCMKVSIDTAWKRRGKNNIRQATGITFDDFSRCPTAKEFIYYLANKLYNYNREEKFKASLKF